MSDEDPLTAAPSRARSGSRPGLRIALLYNLKANAPAMGESAPPDALDELDDPHHVEAYAAALRSGGHIVYPMEGNEDLARVLRQGGRRVDICFNTCEGFRGDSREAQVPALLEMMGIPYTAARVLGLAITLDKAMTKRVLVYHGLPTPPFQEFHAPDQPLDPSLRFPLFAKPNREGMAIGIDRRSIVRDEAALRERMAYLLDAYRETVLVEEYVDGRDVTCGLIGNLADPSRPTLPEGIPSSSGHPGGPADWNGLHLFPIAEVNHAAYEPDRPPIYSHRLKVDLADEYHSICPADVPEEVGDQVRRLTVETFRVTQCLDMARVDFRLDRRDHLAPQILEINALPGITPISDLTLCAQAEGWEYRDLILGVLDAAVARQNVRPSVGTGRPRRRTAPRAAALRPEFPPA